MHGAPSHPSLSVGDEGVLVRWGKHGGECTQRKITQCAHAKGGGDFSQSLCWERQVGMPACSWRISCSRGGGFGGSQVVRALAGLRGPHRYRYSGTYMRGQPARLPAWWPSTPHCAPPPPPFPSPRHLWIWDSMQWGKGMLGSRLQSCVCSHYGSLITFESGSS